MQIVRFMFRPALPRICFGLVCLAVTACAGPQTSSKSVPEEKAKVPAKGVPSEPGAQELAPKGPVQEAIEKGLSYLSQGNPGAAQALLEKTAESHGEVGKLHNALGVVYKSQGKIDEAIAAYKKAIELRDGHVEAYYNLGILYREKGMFKEAEAEYRHALFLKSDFAPAHYNLGVLYDLYLNRPKQALEHYKTYRRLGGQNEKVDIWIKDLERRTGASAPPPAASALEEVP